jgi:hypothetical protein
LSGKNRGHGIFGRIDLLYKSKRGRFYFRSGTDKKGWFYFSKTRKGAKGQVLQSNISRGSNRGGVGPNQQPEITGKPARIGISGDQEKPLRGRFAFKRWGYGALKFDI